MKISLERLLVVAYAMQCCSAFLQSLHILYSSSSPTLAPLPRSNLHSALQHFAMRSRDDLTHASHDVHLYYRNENIWETMHR